MKVLIKALLMACGVTMAASSATADGVEHEVIMLRYGYFPERIYVQPGDTIRFINQTPQRARVLTRGYNDNYSGYSNDNPCANPNSYAGEKDGWYTYYIARGGSTTVKVRPCMETQLEAPYISYYRWYSHYNRANIIFGDAPIGH